MEAELRKPEILKTREPFKSLFPTPKAVWEAVFNDMRVRGYDPAFPIVTWDDTVIDGHTRLEVAKQLRKGVYVVEKGFVSTKAALDYAIHSQRDRRNLTPEGLRKAVAAIDTEEIEKAEARQKELAGSHGKTLAPQGAKVSTGKSAAATGEALGVSARQVERARVVNKPDTPQEIKDKVDSGDLSLKKGAELARQAKKEGMTVHYASNRLDWGTPVKFFKRLDAEFGFTLDVCATERTAKCREFFTPEMDGLKQRWYGICWMNPPYGNEIAAWMEKAYRESRTGTTVVCLVPSRTDTNWWHEYVMKAAEIRFVRGRLRFEGAEASAPFPSAVVVLHQGCEGPPVVSGVKNDD